jgi:hypothetical protein
MAVSIRHYKKFLSPTLVIGTNPTINMDLRLRYFYVCVALDRQRPCDRLITLTKKFYKIPVIFLVSDEWEEASGPDPQKRRRRRRRNMIICLPYVLPLISLCAGPT